MIRFFCPERLWLKWLYQFKYSAFLEDAGGPDYNQHGSMITNLHYLKQWNIEIMCLIFTVGFNQ
jgi:hypothetical protein